MAEYWINKRGRRSLREGRRRLRCPLNWGTAYKSSSEIIHKVTKIWMKGDLRTNRALWLVAVCIGAFLCFGIFLVSKLTGYIGYFFWHFVFFWCIFDVKTYRTLWSVVGFSVSFPDSSAAASPSCVNPLSSPTFLLIFSLLPPYLLVIFFGFICTCPCPLHLIHLRPSSRLGHKIWLWVESRKRFRSCTQPTSCISM